LGFLLARNLASPYLGHEPKAKVATYIIKTFFVKVYIIKVVIGLMEKYHLDF
jgi:hypothetical protein